MIKKLVSMTKAEIKNEILSVQKIVNDYGLVLEKNKNPINDINTLSASKEDIKNAIKILIAYSYLSKDLSEVDLLKAGYIQLGSFQSIKREDLTHLDTMNNLSSLTDSIAPIDPQKRSANELQKMKEVIHKIHDSNSVSLSYLNKSNLEINSLRLELDDFVKSQLLELDDFVKSLKLQALSESKTNDSDVKSNSIQANTEIKSKKKPKKGIYMCVIMAVIAMIFIGARQLHPGGIRWLISDFITNSSSNTEVKIFREKILNYLIPIGASAICMKEHGENTELTGAVMNYAERNEAPLKKLIDLAKAAGGMSKSEKDLLDRQAYSESRRFIDQNINACSVLAARINSGEFDLRLE